ncbi:MAG: sensor histidine kinase [Bacteroidota bacterium]
MFGLRQRYVFILLLAGYSFFNILFTAGDQLIGSRLPNGLLLVTVVVLVSGIWEYNRMVESRLAEIHIWFRKKIHPLFLLFAISLPGVLIITSLTLWALTLLPIPDLAWDRQHLVVIFAFGFRMNLFLNCVNAIYFYTERLRKTELEASQLKKSNMEAQFEALRTQINPHFLFNCLNALSTLVYRDADVSATFISQLSNVYRYLLYNQEKKLVTLQEELNFLDSYLYLLKIRFGDNILIQQDVSPEIDNLHVPPASLQLLIENAIKHNVVSSRNPLRIQLKAVQGVVVVSNNLQEKTIKEESTFIGLQNIRKRFAFLTEDPVKVEKSESMFRVTLPLIKIES